MWCITNPLTHIHTHAYTQTQVQALEGGPSGAAGSAGKSKKARTQALTDASLSSGTPDKAGQTGQGDEASAVMLQLQECLTDGCR